MEHNHQENQSGRKQKKTKTNKQEPLFIGISKYIKWLLFRMFHFRTISSLLGPHWGGGRGIQRWTPLTSNPVKWKSKLHFRSDFQDNFLCRSIFWFSPTQPICLVWEDLIFFSFLFFFVAVDPMANSEWWPSVFSVRWVCWAFSPTRKWQHPSFSPTRNSAKPFSPLTQGRGWCVCGTLVCPEAALGLLWSRVVQLRGMFGFPASCGLLLRYCIHCNIMLHVQGEQ